MNGYRSASTAAHIAIDFQRWLSKAFEKQSLAQRCLAAVPFIVLILYIQFTTEKLRISAPASPRAWAEVVHSELLIVLFIFFVPFLFGFFRRHYLAVLCAFYLVCFLDFVSWFTIDRPIQPTDLLHAAAMIQDYSEFVGQLGRPLLAKILFLALAPIAIWLFGKWTLHKRLAARLTNIAPKAFFGAALVYVGALPFVYKPGYFQHNTFIRIGEEAVYQSRLARLPADTATLQKLFGISTPSLDQPAASAPATRASRP